MIWLFFELIVVLQLIYDKKKQLLAMDLSTHASMKNAANCDT